VNNSHETRVLNFLNALHTTEPDFAKLTKELFAEDAQYQPLVPLRDPVKGRDAICAELERQYEFYNECACEIRTIASSDRSVFTERVDTVTLKNDGSHIVTLVNAVFDVDPDGNVTGWREYYDSAPLCKQLGVTLEQFEQIMAAG
jgi:limonene-1,2-epoxide hydrolase